MKTLSNYIKANKFPLISLAEKLIINKDYNNVDEKCPFELDTNFFVINLAISSASEQIDRSISIDKFTVYDFENTDKNKVGHDVKIYKSTSVYMVGDNTQQYGVCTYKIRQSKNRMQYGIYLNSDYTDNIKKLIDFMLDDFTSNHKINKKPACCSIVLRKLFEILEIDNPFNNIDVEPSWSFTYSSYTLNELIRLKGKL